MVSCKRSQVPAAAVVVEQREDRTRSRPAPSQHTRRPIRHWSRRAVGCRATAAPVRPVCATSSDSGLRPAWLPCMLVCRSWVRFFRSRSVPRGTDIIVLASRRATHREKSPYVYVLGTMSTYWARQARHGPAGVRVHAFRPRPSSASRTTRSPRRSFTAWSVSGSGRSPRSPSQLRLTALGQRGTSNRSRVSGPQRHYGDWEGLPPPDLPGDRARRYGDGPDIRRLGGIVRQSTKRPVRACRVPAFDLGGPTRT